jgi:predicted N-formylglutamate amidohydrolase
VQGLRGRERSNDGFDEQMTLLCADEPAPFSILEVEPAWPALLVCDHASNRIPAGMHELGVAQEHLATHLALDIGAGDIARYLSRALGLPAVLMNYSRLVVDCNRRLDDPTAFSVGDGDTVVPGNLTLNHADRQMRADSLYWPYHHAIRDELGKLAVLGKAPALISMHSFTPVFRTAARPWHIGILWDTDPRMPAPLIESLGAIPDVVVGDNEPYSGRDPHDFTIDHHGEAEGLPHVSIEIRQDLIETEAGVQHWGSLLAGVLAPILDDPELYSFWTR